MSGEKRSGKRPAILVYSLLLYSLWTLWEFWGADAVDGAVGSEYVSQLIQSGVKLLIWTVPALCLTRHFRNDAYVGLKDMLTKRVSVLPYLPVFLGFTVYLAVGTLLVGGRAASGGSLRYSELIGLLFVGVTEETVFRGWLLNATVSEERKRLPVIVNAVMFLLIHFPVWIADGQFTQAIVSLNFLCIPALSVIFSWAFLKSKSLWVPIVLHMYWDLLVFFLY